jgi:hypothetical protein
MGDHVDGDCGEGRDPVSIKAYQTITHPGTYGDVDATAGAYAYGFVSDAVAIIGVWGRVGNTPYQEGYKVGDTAWKFYSVKTAYLGPNNNLLVSSYIKNTTGYPYYSYIRSTRTFHGLKGYTAEEYTSVLMHRWEDAREALDQVLPRYWQLTIERLPKTARVDGLQIGSPVYLTYDAMASTDVEAVWRGTNPSDRSELLGTWAFRVHREGQHYMAQLSLMQLDDRVVQPPLVVYVEDFSLRGCDGLTLGGSETEPDEAIQLRLAPA